MDRELKLFLGKILGETYRVQRRLGQGVCGEDDATIYGLLHGIEEVVDEHMEMFVDEMPSDAIQIVTNILRPYHQGVKKLKGFYDIEGDLQRAGISRGQAAKILTYLKASGGFLAEIAAMDSDNSPGECRTFELGDWDD